MYYNKRVAYYTLGCKLNFSETSAIAQTLSDQGYVRVDFSEIADYYIVNTCSVTENADKKCTSIVRQIKKRSPESKVILIGCFAQLKTNELATYKGVDMVLGAKEKFSIHQHIAEAHWDAPIVKAGAIKEVDFYMPSFSQGERTRTFLKVQDGCDYFCSFCTIPLARGKSRSQSIQQTIDVAKKAARTGVKEIVLTGINIGDFGKTPNGKSRTSESFYDLICALEKIEQVDRWRISSIEPNLLTDEIIDFVAQSNSFMPHFHIPLQSGSDRVLRSMRRKYDVAHYVDRIQKIKATMPHCCIGVDVIVGFHGETDEDFLETYQFLLDIDISYLHVFSYSERANTKALSMDERVPIHVRRERSKMLRNLSAKKKRHFYEQHVGKTFPVLFEAQNDGGWMYGFTSNYIKVAMPYSEELINQVREVSISSIRADQVAVGEFAEKIEFV